MKVNLSVGNEKLGRIASVSLPPIKTCAKNAPCKDKCYAVQLYTQYPAVKKCYDENYDIYLTDRKFYFQNIIDQFNSKHIRDLFRFQVSGDMPDLDYLIGMIKFAETFPLTKIMAYTKQFDILRQVRSNHIPKNLSICLSLWPNGKEDLSGLSKAVYPRVYMKDLCGVETRIPRTAKECSGFCKDCQECYSQGRKSVYIYEHGNGVAGRIKKIRKSNPKFKFGKTD